MELINKLNVLNTTSLETKQTCNVGVDPQVKIFSYKCCDAEDNLLQKGKDYAFTLTYGNMGECSGRTMVCDSISVNNIGGIQFKIMDTCGPCNGYDVWLRGSFYWPKEDVYIRDFGAIPLQLYEILNLEPVVCKDKKFEIHILDWDSNRRIEIGPHKINTFSAILKVENIFCEDCPDFYNTVSSSKNEGQDIKDIEFIDIDINLSDKELEARFKELLKI